MRMLSNDEVKAVSGGAESTATDWARVFEGFRNALGWFWLFLQGKSWSDIT